MDGERLIQFAVFMAVVVVIGFVLRQRLVRARKTGDDPVYGIASINSDSDDPVPSKTHSEGLVSNDR